MSPPSVELVGVGKRFRADAGHGTFAEWMGGFLRRAIRPKNDRNRQDRFWAVRDLSFEVARGEAVGVIGPNGAGKSTVLKLLAGILVPDSGRIAVRGRVTALIEVGAGFHGDLTGRENIYLNGAILGMRRAQVRAKLDDIVAFAGVEKFLDMPVKRYSSGMYARLGFSIAAHVDPDVLLVDEVLSVGDAVFRLRCLDRMQALIRNGATLVFVTHQLDQVQSICRRAIVLDGGTCTFQGPSRDAIAHYLSAMTNGYPQRPTDVSAGDSDGAMRAEIRGLRLLDCRDRPAMCFPSGDALSAKVDLFLNRAITNLIVELNLRGITHDHLLSFNSGRSGVSFACAAGEHTISVHLPRVPLAGGQYFWNVRLWDANAGASLVDTPYRFPMLIEDGGRATGALCLEHTWLQSAPRSQLAAELLITGANLHPKAAEDSGGATRENLLVR